MRITLPDFAAGIIAVWFLVAVFVCPFIAAWHVLYPPKHRLHSDPHTSTPRKAGATYTHKEKKGLGPIGPANVSAGVTPERDPDPARCLSVLGEARGSAECDFRKEAAHEELALALLGPASETCFQRSDLDGMLLASDSKAINCFAGHASRADRAFNRNQDAAMRSQGMPPRKDLPIHPGMTDRRDGRLEDCSSNGGEPYAGNVSASRREGRRSVAQECRTSREIGPGSISVGSLQGNLTDTQVPDDGQRDRTRTGSANAAKSVTGWRDSHSEDSFRSGLFALTWGGDPSQEMGRGGASLEGVPPKFLRPLLAASHLCSVDAPLLASLVQRESDWRADAVSTAGAIGLGQLMPRTARAMRVDPWVPAQNLIGAACHLRAMLDRYKGDERRALIAYHRGAWAKGPTPQASHDYASDVIQGAN